MIHTLLGSTAGSKVPLTVTVVPVISVIVLVINLPSNPITCNVLTQLAETLLAGKSVNAYFYKEGKYSRILKQFAPTVFENAAESFKENDVEYWKGRAIKYFTDYVEPKLDNTKGHDNDDFVSSAVTNEESTVSDDEAIPF